MTYRIDQLTPGALADDSIFEVETDPAGTPASEYITGLQIREYVLEDFSANGLSLVGAANYAAMRGLLDLEPGVDFVAYSAFSANGISLVGAANYAAMRGLLDLEAGTDFYSISSTDTLLAAKVTGPASVTDGRFALFDSTTGKLIKEHTGAPGALAVLNTVGSSQIDNSAVTYAKIQNVSATSRVLGRKTSGAGVPEELTYSEVLDFVGSAAQGDILYRNGTVWTRLGAGTAGQILKTGGAAANPAWATNEAVIQFVIDGGGATITTGVKGFLEIPFACTITRATALADQSGSIVVDIWKDTYANYPPTDADSITASAPVTISSATKSQDATLTGWTASVAAGDIIGFNVDSITTCQRVTISLKVTKT